MLFAKIHLLFSLLLQTISSDDSHVQGSVIHGGRPFFYSYPALRGIPST